MENMPRETSTDPLRGRMKSTRCTSKNTQCNRSTRRSNRDGQLNGSTDDQAASDEVVRGASVLQEERCYRHREQEVQREVLHERTHQRPTEHVYSTLFENKRHRTSWFLIASSHRCRRGGGGHRERLTSREIGNFVIIFEGAIFSNNVSKDSLRLNFHEDFSKMSKINVFRQTRENLTKGF